MPELNKIYLVELLITKIADHVEIEIDSIDPAKNLDEIGLSSLHAVIISGELEDALEIEIDPMIMFENKTINEVADKIMLLNNG
ncbi:acyl carrier protein [Pedobacter polysacchareus]|uniref:acyl carrier protein n=1 Tax=Pedobacter polysacchareus TaxID=2861973 RepID=UPI001C9A2B05|nr:acyl carrier protein [Pedobacter polysacchareus]